MDSRQAKRYATEIQTHLNRGGHSSRKLTRELCSEITALADQFSDAEQALDEHLAVALRYVPATP